jgi:hypothetical protein
MWTKKKFTVIWQRWTFVVCGGIKIILCLLHEIIHRSLVIIVFCFSHFSISQSQYTCSFRMTIYYDEQEISRYIFVFSCLEMLLMWCHMLVLIINKVHSMTPGQQYSRFVVDTISGKNIFLFFHHCFMSFSPPYLI